MVVVNEFVPEGSSIRGYRMGFEMGWTEIRGCLGVWSGLGIEDCGVGRGVPDGLEHRRRLLDGLKYSFDLRINFIARTQIRSVYGQQKAVDPRAGTALTSRASSEPSIRLVNRDFTVRASRPFR